MAERMATITSRCVFDIKNSSNFDKLKEAPSYEQAKSQLKNPVFSLPDFTVGCGITPHQLALADF